MKAWLGSVLLVVTGALAVGAGCGKPTVKNNPSRPDTGVGGNSGSSGNTGVGGNSGTYVVDLGGGTGDGCPSSCDTLNANCGFVTDAKCGGVVMCGACTGTDVCGGTDANRCGPAKQNLEDAGSCMPSTCVALGASCGFVTDKTCGGVIDCGQDVCPGHCTNATCGTDACAVDPATTCSGRGYVCGQTIDSCGNVLDCGAVTCPNTGDSCVQGVCTPPTTCKVDPTTTCAGRGYSCGQAADNCGHLLTCGPSACPIPGWSCGGGASPGVCGCSGACSQIPTCAAGVTTTLAGKVYDPAGRNPLYHVLVYIANAPSDPALKTFPAGVTCDVCGATAAGSPLISTPGASDPPAGEFTDVNGSFTLKNVPAGNVTVVIQLGRWRRTFPVNIANPCAPNTIPDKTLLMPSSRAQGNIPLIAMVTGRSDSLECVLRKIGIAQSEFSNPGQGGRVHFFLGDKFAGQSIDAATPTQAQLFANGINAYDLTILACQGEDIDESANQTALRNYAAAGGRVFATHRSHTWLRNNNANTATPTDPTADNWSQVAKWNDGDTAQDFSEGAYPVVGILDLASNPKANAFQGWLSAVDALNPGTPPSTTVFVVRHQTDAISSVAGQTQQWLYRNGIGRCTVSNATCVSNAECAPNSCVGSYVGKQTPVHFTFNTPVNLVQDLTKTPPAVQCGRVLFSDFHVSDANESAAEFYPSQCAEDVSRATPNPMVCKGNPKKTCTVATQAADCLNDTAPCVTAGTCTSDAQCTGTCTAGKCPWGTPCSTSAQCASTCSSGVCLDPMTAQEKLLEYMLFDLGSCVPPAKVCVPTTSCPAGQECGYAPDGCGGLVACGDCPDGKSCGVGEPPVANKCGKVACTPHACPADVACGFASDGCSGVANCGTCPSGKTCNNGKCGSAGCTPKSCQDQGLECGQAGDACGQVITCPACPANNACVAGKCVPLTCTPQTCAAQGIQCGQAADGCGNKIADCGTCSAGALCNAGKCVQLH
ncbi:MAG: hypothetical protein WDO74_26840 [Pseudomonadota bacterium]